MGFFTLVSLSSTQFCYQHLMHVFGTPESTFFRARSRIAGFLHIARKEETTLLMKQSQIYHNLDIFCISITFGQLRRICLPLYLKCRVYL